MSKFDAMSSEELCSEAQKLRVDSDTIKHFCDGELSQKDLIRIIAQVISRSVMFIFLSIRFSSVHACVRAFVRACACARMRVHVLWCVVCVSIWSASPTVSKFNHARA